VLEERPIAEAHELFGLPETSGLARGEDDGGNHDETVAGGW
jgi:hypothetical protein